MNRPMKTLLLLAMMMIAAVPAFAAGPTATLQAQIVPVPAGGPGAPAVAQAAGFTTLAANFDFSQPAYATQSNWMDCSQTNNAVTWHNFFPSNACNFFQVTDPATGDTVMRNQWLPLWSFR